MIIFALLLLGLCFGSFINALVWRLHEQETAKPKNKKTKASSDLSIIYGRSMCPHCKHQLAAKDLIPIFSWLQLRGKCRYCHKQFDDTPLTELLLPALFILSYSYWPWEFDINGKVLFAIWLVVLVGLLAMIIYDFRWMLLPNRVVFPLLVLVVFQALLMASVFNGGLEAIKGSFFGLLVGGGIFYVLFQVSGGKWIGGGDVKLGAVLGILVGGPSMALLMLFLASCLGTITSLPLLLSGKANKNSKIPFGPYLIAASIIVYLFGTSLVSWYKQRVLLY